MLTCRYEGCARDGDGSIVFTPINTELPYCEEHRDVIKRYFAQELDTADCWTPPRKRSLDEIEADQTAVTDGGTDRSVDSDTVREGGASGE